MPPSRTIPKTSFAWAQLLYLTGAALFLWRCAIPWAIHGSCAFAFAPSPRWPSTLLHDHRGISQTFSRSRQSENWLSLRHQRPRDHADMQTMFRSQSDKLNVHQHPTRKMGRNNARLTLSSGNLKWDGDDLRFLSRLKRRLRRSFFDLDGFGGGGGGRPIRNALMLACILVSFCQTMDTIRFLAQEYPTHWPQNAPYMVWDALMANASPGPVERAFCYHHRLAPFQPHRYLTYGFLHRGILHIALNMNELRRQPAWLETGLGGALYLTTFLLSMIAGCFGHASWGVVRAQPILLGASAGICGLYGLQFASLGKMKKAGASYGAVWGTAIVMLYSLLLEGVSNAAHVAGFLAGIASGILFGPSYSSNYAMRRKWSTYVDNEPREYRVVMGFGVKSNKLGLIPLSIVWILALGLMVAVPKYRAIPATIVRGIVDPVSLSY